MGVRDKGYATLTLEQQHWRKSNIMKIPNTNLLHALGASERIGGRLWRLPPYSANTWHRHVDSWEFYFLLEGVGRIRVGEETISVDRYGSVLVAPHMLRQVFNDTSEEALWLILGAPQESPEARPSDAYPEDPTSLPKELAGRVWPPRDRPQS